MCGDKESTKKIWIKFNKGYSNSIIIFVITLIVALIRFIIIFFPSAEKNINGEAFTIATETLLTITTLIFGFYLANYKVRKDARVSIIENYIQDFTDSHKSIKNILEDFKYIRFESLYEIKKVVKTIDLYFGLHYFNIFIGNNKLASIYISEQISKFMVSINKSMNDIDKNFSKLEYQFKIDKSELIKLINIYIQDIINIYKSPKNEKFIESRDKHIIEFGKNFTSLLKDEKMINEAKIYAIELLGNIETILAKDYIDEIINKLSLLEKSLIIKSRVLRKTITKCEKNHNNKNDNNFCLKSQEFILNECINKPW